MLMIQPAKEEWRAPLDCVLISLFYIRPFEMPEVNCMITPDRRANKLYMLYLGLSLKNSYSLGKFLSTLNFYK